MLEERDIHQVLALGNADPIAERADRFRRVATPPHADDGRHPRIVPAGDVLFFDQLEQLPFAHHRVRQIQPRELDLPWL
jgi:hypothetical protein